MCSCSELFDNNNISVMDITGVEKDECTGHINDYSDHYSDELRNDCKIQFSDKNALVQENIKNHNEGKKCLNACVMHWEDRIASLYKLLKFTSDVCKKFDIPWVLYFGGLLGLHRDSGLLPWDPDIDILFPYTAIEKLIKDGHKLPIIYETDEYVFRIKDYADKDPKKSKHYDIFKNHKFKVIIGRIINKKNGLYCDIFYWIDTKDSLLISFPNISSPYKEIPRNKFFPLKQVDLNGISIFVPNDIDYNLKTIYGDYNKRPYKKVGDKYMKTN